MGLVRVAKVCTTLSGEAVTLLNDRSTRLEIGHGLV